MNGHLKSKHKNTLLSNKDKLKSPEASASKIPEALTSKIHDIPSSSIEQNKDHNVSNETFMGAFKRQKTISESFGVMVSFKEGGVKSKKLIHAIMFIICKDNQPLSIVEDEAFKYFMKTVSPNFKCLQTDRTNKYSVVASDELRKATNGDGKLIQEVATRWNKKKSKIFLILLRPIEASTKELCGQKYVTSSMVIPMVYMMVKNIIQFKRTQELGIQLKKEIIFHCEKRFGLVESVTFLSIATVLDSQFKKIYFKDPLIGTL
ncbi:uncharacterized protein LOC112595121 [Melanaphis sacchari]|uniref:uncharacterized protein LOC112595121 n=1 Tax=Melanaphis sacchari TaxID=742174 RepID=UPI000DC155B2|nr:uncharacterized protein LOC112595121 [Melanaphis sacchari]